MEGSKSPKLHRTFWGLKLVDLVKFEEKMPLGSLVTWRKELHFLQVLQKKHISSKKSQAVFNRLNTGFKLSVEDNGNFWKASSVHLF